jgi:PAS domain S-box-containing protein
MPKKKKQIDQRLDKLFDDLKHEETRQTTNPDRSAAKPASLPEQNTKKSKPKDKKSKTFRQEQQVIEIPSPGIQPSSAISTAFRTDPNSWATIKVVDETEQKVWGAEDHMLIRQICDQLSLALENARLFQDAQRRALEMTALADVSREISATLELHEVLDRIALKAQELLNASTAAVYIPDSQIKKLVAITVVGNEEEKIKTDHITVGEGIIGNISLNKTGEIVNNYISRSENTLEKHLMACPIMSQEALTGLLVVWRVGQDMDFLNTEFEFLESLAQQAAIAAENARLFTETQERAEELTALNEIISAASETLDTKSILETVMNKVLDITNFDGGLITMFNDLRNSLERAIRIGMPGKAPDDPAEGLDGSLCNYVYSNSEVLILQDIGKNTPSGVNVESELRAGLHGYIGIPIETKGHTLGTLCLFRYTNENIPENIVSIVQTIGGQLGFALENARLFDESRKFRLGLERSADAVFMTDIEGTIVYANPGFEIIYGFSPSEILGENPRILKSGLLTQENYEQFWGTLLAKETVSGEILNKRKDGELIPIFGTNSPILNSQGNILGFLAIHTDISDRKENEVALRRRNEYLAAATEIGRIVTSTLILDEIYSLTVNLVVERFGYYYAAVYLLDDTIMNARLQEATRVPGKKLKQENYSLVVGETSIVGKTAQSKETTIVNDISDSLLYMTNPHLPETRSEAGFPLRVGDRMIGVLDIQSSESNAFSADDAAILQLLADQIAIGIENASLYNKTQEAYEEMLEVDRLKSQFLANMSHELRTPLNSIIGFARVILKGIDGPTTDLQKQDLTAIFNSGQHLLGLINDILDLSRIEAGKMELAFDDVNIVELIGSVMSTAVGLVKDKPVRLNREIQEDLPFVRADPMRIRQVVLNLISNASKFTEEGEILVTAKLQKGDNGHREVYIAVTDTGPGISPDDQEKLFQAFSQVDASLTRKVGGTGLGLAISQNLVNMHGGKIGVTSIVGEGSTFYFTIPAYSISEDSKIVLVIDDEPQIVALYERYLQGQGYQVIGHYDPSSAKERAKQIKPFAITLDIMMPGIDGWQVLNDLKTDGDTKSIPVIICSIIEDEEKGFNLGAADYIVKPILEDDLLLSLNRLDTDEGIREVLVIDDNSNDLRSIGKILAKGDRYKPVLAKGGPTDWDIIIKKTPHAIVLDLFKPEMDGFAILENLRTDSRLKNIPVIAISGTDLTPEQQSKLKNFGKGLTQIGSLDEDDLLKTLENALKRVNHLQN